MDCHNIVKSLQDELGYILIESGDDSWLFQSGEVKLKFNKKTLEEHYYSSSTLYRNSLKRAEKMTNDLILKNWKEHRRIDEERRGSS
jgi:hypothetical protein